MPVSSFLGSSLSSHSLARRAAPALLALSALACSKDEGAVSTAHAEARATARNVTPPDVVLPGIVASATPYVGETVTNGGTVSGVVQLAAPIAIPDSTIQPPDEISRTCGGSFLDRTLELDGPNVRGAVVWLEGVSRGKALPTTRRFEVTLDHCRLQPRVQPMVAGGTVQLHTRDALRSLVRIVEWPGATLRSTIATNNEGEVVPDDRAVAAAGAYEVKGAQPTWLRAWLLAFDHPYFTSTGTGGTYTIGEIPPGSYKLVAWHERLGRVEVPVTITAGQTTTIALRFDGLKPGTGAVDSVSDTTERPKAR